MVLTGCGDGKLPYWSRTSGGGLGADPPKLTCSKPKQMALQNHPQIQAAQHEAYYASQQVTVNRSAYYPRSRVRFDRARRATTIRASARGIFRPRVCSTASQGAVVNN